jgi:acid phosphatase (class A)
MKKLVLAAACLLSAAAVPALARDPIFVAPDQTQGFEILHAPPANESDATRAELAELHRLESTRTKEQSEQAIWDDQNEHIFIYQNVLGEKFNEQNLPLTAAFGKRVRNDEGLNTAAAKTGFHRVRPYNLDKTLHPICKTGVKDDSYPSGHTTSGYLLALALIDLVPEKRDEILSRADGYGFDRLVCGVHYPSDLEASKLLAYAIHAAMAQNPQYKQEMAVARSELRAALGLPEAR